MLPSLLNGAQKKNSLMHVLSQSWYLKTRCPALGASKPLPFVCVAMSSDRFSVCWENCQYLEGWQHSHLVSGSQEQWISEMHQ